MYGGLYYVRRSRGPRKRRWQARLAQLRPRAACVVRGHAWGIWSIDDYDGPGEDLGDGMFMPWLSRESLPGEYGMRFCKRCRANETRWPPVGAPPGVAKRWPLRAR